MIPSSFRIPSPFQKKKKKGCTDFARIFFQCHSHFGAILAFESRKSLGGTLSSYFTELKWGSMLVVISVLLQSDQLLLNCKKRSLSEGMQQLFSVAWTNDKYFLLLLYYNTIWKSKSPRHFNTLVPCKFVLLLLLLKRLRFLPVVHALLSTSFLHISPSVLSSSPLVSHLLGLLFNKSHKPSIPW